MFLLLPPNYFVYISDTLLCCFKNADKGAGVAYVEETLLNFI
jgi:hypothetical protein